MKNMTRIELETMPTELGDFTIALRNGAVCAAEFSGDEGRMEKLLARRFGGLQLVGDNARSGPGSEAAAAVRRYFDGEVTALGGIPVDLAGTGFQLRVWRALREIPPGETRSYAHIARAIHAPKAFRAVGMANNRNPVALIVPCHRVIGADGSLTGYAHGLKAKKWLLDHEAAL